MKALLCAGVLALTTVAAAAQESKLGTGVSLKEATPITTLLNHPEEFVGKTIRIDGVATSVCEHKGCWLAISTSEAKDAETIRIKVDHDGGIVFPMTAKGKQVSAEGIFEVVADGEDHAKHDATAKQTSAAKPGAAGTASPAAKPDPHAAHGAHEKPAAAAGEHAAHGAKKYQIKATGATIR